MIYIRKQGYEHPRPYQMGVGSQNSEREANKIAMNDITIVEIQAWMRKRPKTDMKSLKFEWKTWMTSLTGF